MPATDRRPSSPRFTSSRPDAATPARAPKLPATAARLLAAAALAILTSCATTTPAIDEGVKLRDDTKVSCARHCDALGMKLGAIVLIQNSAGCVCEPADDWGDVPPRASSGAGAGAIAGGALIALEQERERARAEERRRQEEEDQRRRDEEERRRREEEEQARRDAERRERDRATRP